MIKLIVSDMDGTLIPTGGDRVSKEAKSLILQLKTKGIAFAASSGRTYGSIRYAFSGIEDEIMYVTQNGAAAYYNEKRLFYHPISKDMAQQIVEDVHQCSACDCMVSTERGYYIIIPTSGILNNYWDEFPYEVIRVHDVYEVEEEICQVTLFQKGKAHEYAEHFIVKWKDHLEVSLISEDCIDFSPRNKGEGLLELCQELQIDTQEVMTFGNSYNDISMLKLSGMSYIMADAPELLRRQVKNQCKSVEEVLKTLLRTL